MAQDTKKTSDYLPKIQINGETLDIVEETKFLGVILDSELSWTKHISYTSKKLAKSIAILSKTRPFFNKTTLIQLYYSFMYPYLIYGNLLWGNAPAKILWPIYKLQKIAIRLITNTKRGNSTQIHCKNLRLLRLPEIYTYSTSIFMYKYHHNMMPIALDSLFIKNNAVHNYNTRGATLLRNPKIRTGLADRFITATGVRIWNNLSLHTDTTQKISTFKQKIITSLVSTYGNWQTPKKFNAFYSSTRHWKQTLIHLLSLLSLLLMSLNELLTLTPTGQRIGYASNPVGVGPSLACLIGLTLSFSQK